mmetsp:Transcript_62125/g.71218  ORF Transcript_62125/g.71218 Transcript_62125/m.71218 type:complete len:96 (+) Transcript_62125:915-1202(+)
MCVCFAFLRLTDILGTPLIVLHQTDIYSTFLRCSSNPPARAAWRNSNSQFLLLRKREGEFEDNSTEYGLCLLCFVFLFCLEDSSERVRLENPILN